RAEGRTDPRIIVPFRARLQVPESHGPLDPSALPHPCPEGERLAIRAEDQLINVVFETCETSIDAPTAQVPQSDRQSLLSRFPFQVPTGRGEPLTVRAKRGGRDSFTGPETLIIASVDEEPFASGLDQIPDFDTTDVTVGQHLPVRAERQPTHRRPA